MCAVTSPSSLPGIGKSPKDAISRSVGVNRLFWGTVRAREFFVGLWRWFTWKHVCAWCVPQRRLAGNPWARNVTHTICLPCMERQRMALIPKETQAGEEARSPRAGFDGLPTQRHSMPEQKTITSLHDWNYGEVKLITRNWWARKCRVCGRVDFSTTVSGSNSFPRRRTQFAGARVRGPPLQISHGWPGASNRLKQKHENYE